MKTFLILFISTNFLISCGNKKSTTSQKILGIPIVTISPNYPRSAAIEHIEGWVKLEFTITTNGSVKSPVVLDSHPKGVFEREAIRALLKYKFAPKIVNGKAFEFKTTQKIEFRLAQ